MDVATLEIQVERRSRALVCRNILYMLQSLQKAVLSLPKDAIERRRAEPRVLLSMEEMKYSQNEDR